MICRGLRCNWGNKEGIHDGESLVIVTHAQRLVRCSLVCAFGGLNMVLDAVLGCIEAGVGLQIPYDLGFWGGEIELEGSI